MKVTDMTGTDNGLIKTEHNVKLKQNIGKRHKSMNNIIMTNKININKLMQ